GQALQLVLGLVHVALVEGLIDLVGRAVLFGLLAQAIGLLGLLAEEVGPPVQLLGPLLHLLFEVANLLDHLARLLLGIDFLAGQLVALLFQAVQLGRLGEVAGLGLLGNGLELFHLLSQDGGRLGVAGQRLFALVAGGLAGLGMIEESEQQERQ